MVAGDQRLIHTPFVPSGYWSPCAPLVWNQGFPTPLGGLSVSTNPVKAPDIRFSSSQFRKQHPRHEKAVSRTSLAEAIYSRGHVRAFREGERTLPTLGRTRAFGGLLLSACNDR